MQNCWSRLGFPDFSLAVSTLPSPESPEAIGWVVIIIGGFLVSIHYGLSIWKQLFPAKTPPDHEVWATKIELARLEKDHKAEMHRIERDHKLETARIEQRFEQWISQQSDQHDEKMKVWTGWREDMSEWQLTMERAMGHVETKAEIAINNGKKPGTR